VVSIPEEIQIERLMERDGLPKEDAKKRLESQMPLSEKIKYAHRVIDNSGTIARTREKLDCIWKEVNNYS
jgi:dephospho-CoA kinase